MTYRPPQSAPAYQPPAPPPTKRSKLPLILGLAVGVPLLILVALAALGAALDNGKPTAAPATTAPSAAAPAAKAPKGEAGNGTGNPPKAGDMNAFIRMAAGVKH